MTHRDHAKWLLSTLRSRRVGDWHEPEYLHVGTREYVVVHDSAITVSGWDGALETCGTGMPAKRQPQVSSADAANFDFEDM